MFGVNQQNMNGTNKFLLLKTIATKGTVSRVELSRLTGLSKMTVTTLISEYIEQGIVRECGTTDTKTGRRPTLLEAVPDSLLTLGIDIGRDFIEVGIVDLCGKVQCFDHVPITRILSGQALIGEILRLCDAALQQTQRENVWGIGVSCIGPMNVREGIILNPPDFNGIENIAIVSVLKQQYNLPVYMGIDMCVSALAELYFGKGRTIDNFLYIGISAGIGSGLVLNRQLYQGQRGFAGVLGHAVVEWDGEQCQCGNKGCLEAYSSVHACVQWAKKQGAPEDLTWMLLLERVESGDEICRQALERMYRYIEMVVISAVNMLDVECVFLGGDIWYGGKYFVDRLNRAIEEKQFFRAVGPLAKVMVSQFSSNASFIGTAALVMENNMRPSMVKVNLV